MLLAAPRRSAQLAAKRRELGGAADKVRVPFAESSYNLPGGTNAGVLTLTLPRTGKGKDVADWRVRAPHQWGTEESGSNDRRIAHVRFNERVGENGKRVLFLEEIQSDWHQKGRTEGYSQKEKIPGSIVYRGPEDTPPGTTLEQIPESGNWLLRSDRDIYHGYTPEDAIRDYYKHKFGFPDIR